VASGTAPSGTPTPAPAKQPGSGSKPSGVQAAAQAPKVIALQFYAEWCPGCKALQPKPDEAMKDAAGQIHRLLTSDQATDLRIRPQNRKSLFQNDNWSDLIREQTSIAAAR